MGIADIDGDGKLDIAILPNSKGVAVLRNTSTSTNPNSMSFAAPATLAKATTYSNMAVADMDGDGKVDITVTNASAGNLTVLRSAPKLSSDNNLTNISITAGALSPVFDSLTLFYSINVRNYVTSTTVTATKNQDSAKIEIQYNSGVYTSFVSGSVSSSLPLNVGTNVINFKVTAQNGGVKIYSIVITRACLASPSTTNLAICPSQLPFTWNGTVFTAPSTQGVILTTANGCDSTAMLVLSLKAATSSTTNLSICSSELPYSWNGLTFTTAGSQTKKGLVNSQGCDSSATLNLTVKLATVSDTVRATINQGQSYTFNGTNYNTTGIFLTKLVNAAGCDSTAILSLTVIAPYSVTGNIIHPTGAAVQRVSMNVNAVNTATVNTTGNYTLSLMPGNDYSIKPSKNNDFAKTNGVTVADVLLVQSHILGNAIFNSPYKIIAADVNNSGDVTTLDILLIKRLILGLDSTFKGKRMWAFVDSSYKFTDPLNPFPFKDSISFTNLSSNKTNQSFIGIKLGDVNYDWNNTVLGNQAAAKPIAFYYNNINLGKEQEIVVPIRVKNFNEMIGMQYTMNFNSKVFQLKSVNNTALTLEYGTNHLSDGKISFLWNDAQLQPQSLPDGSVLFELVFTKLSPSIKEEDIALSSDISVIEAWDASYQKHNIIKTAGKITSAPEFATKENWQVSPNPSKGEVKVDLSLSSNKTIRFQLTSVDGRLVYQKALEANSGNSSSKLNFGKQAKLVGGIYFLKAEGVEGVNVKQIEIK